MNGKNLVGEEDDYDWRGAKKQSESWNFVCILVRMHEQWPEALEGLELRARCGSLVRLAGGFAGSVFSPDGFECQDWRGFSSPTPSCRAWSWWCVEVQPGPAPSEASEARECLDGFHDDFHDDMIQQGRSQTNCCLFVFTIHPHVLLQGVYVHRVCREKATIRCPDLDFPFWRRTHTNVL